MRIQQLHSIEVIDAHFKSEYFLIKCIFEHAESPKHSE